MYAKYAVRNNSISDSQVCTHCILYVCILLYQEMFLIAKPFGDILR